MNLGLFACGILCGCLCVSGASIDAQSTVQAGHPFRANRCVARSRSFAPLTPSPTTSSPGPKRASLSDCLDCQGQVDGKAENGEAVCRFPTTTAAAARSAALLADGCRRRMRNRPRSYASAVAHKLLVRLNVKAREVRRLNICASHPKHRKACLGWGTRDSQVMGKRGNRGSFDLIVRYGERSALKMTEISGSENSTTCGQDGTHPARPRKAGGEVDHAGQGSRKLLTRVMGLEMVQVIPVCISPMLPNF